MYNILSNDSDTEDKRAKNENSMIREFGEFVASLMPTHINF